MTIRSTGARVAAFAWLTFAVLNLVDLMFGITGDPTYSLTVLTMGMVLLLGCGIAYTVGLRPAIIGDDEAVTIRNPLRETRAPWSAVRRIEGTNALTVRFTGPDGAELETRAWVHQTSPRAQAKAEARARKEQNRGPGVDLRGRTPAGFAAEQLNEIRERRRPKEKDAEKSARGAVTWSVPAVVSLVVPLVAVIVIPIVEAVR
ncbi:PH domain-containing protein [Actinomadura spongiicola]|nr:PH domain-containing protein [Actinomadura spongiicola]